MRTPSGAGLRLFARILVLAAFAIGLALGLIRFWAAAFIVGLSVEAIKPGRLYCVWLCPVRSVHGLAGMGSAERRKKETQLPDSVPIKAFGRIFLAMFLFLFGISIAFGWRGWLFPSFVALGIIISGLFPLRGFCSNMCPLGAAFVIVRRGPVKIMDFFRKVFPKRPPDAS